jgi:uncharacterized protein YgbK (DUF1537 family)
MPSTTRQLAVLLGGYPGTLVEADVEALASAEPEGEIERAARAASDRLASGGLAVVATPRTPPAATWSFEAGQRAAVNLARVAARVEPRPAVVLAKGGITSHVTARVGLDAQRGTVLGPLVDGVALWRLETGAGRPVSYVVFPGNVGSDETLLDVVDLMLD